MVLRGKRGVCHKSCYHTWSFSKKFDFFFFKMQTADGFNKSIYHRLITSQLTTEFSSSILVGDFIMVLNEVSYAHQDCIYLIKNTVKTDILWNITFIRRFYPKQLTVYSGYTFFSQYARFLGFEPTTFCAADAMLYHWATGTLNFKQ